MQNDSTGYEHDSSIHKQSKNITKWKDNSKHKLSQSHNILCQPETTVVLDYTRIQIGLKLMDENFQSITPDKGRGTCFCPRLSVCLLARSLKKACIDFDEMLRVDRYRDMDELINF